MLKYKDKRKKLINLFNKMFEFLRTYISFRKSRVIYTEKNRFKILVRRAYKLLLVICDLALLPFAFLIVLAVRALRPIVLIRFEQFSHRIGHLAGNTELYLCKRKLKNTNGRKTIDIFYDKPPICNQQLMKMWSRVVHNFYFVHYLDRVNRNLPGGKEHTLTKDLYDDGIGAHDVDLQGLFLRTQPHLFFTSQEERAGLIALRRIGIPEDKPFICFYMRDSAYLKNYFKSDFPYHSYRDCDINNCRLTVEELANRGYYMIRLGKFVKEAFKSDHSKIIDYATKHRTDFLDIFLSAKCKFFIASTAGLSAVPVVFRRPVAWVNIMPLYGDLPAKAVNDIFIPKKLWLEKEGRFMTFREVLDVGGGDFYIFESQEYLQRGIKIIENTAEEIRDLAIEMEERLNNKWQTTQEDEDLQTRFWSLFKPQQLCGKKYARIGSEFLRQNKGLL